MTNTNRENERAQRLEALLAADDEELSELWRIAREIRRLREGSASAPALPQPQSAGKPTLSPERRERIRARAREAFRARIERFRHERELLRQIHRALETRFSVPRCRRGEKGNGPDIKLQEEGASTPAGGPVRLRRRDLLKILGLAALYSFVRGLFAQAAPPSSAALPKASVPALGEEPVQALTVRTVLPDPEQQTPVMLLEAASGKTLPIWIGQPEASAIALSLEGKGFPRPLTHDLFVRALEAVGARLDHVRITHRRDETYHAILVLRDREGELQVVDARPSDAVALALRAGCPVYASERVIEEGAVDLEGIGDSDPAT